MAKRFTQPAIKWIELEKLVPPEQRTSYLAFKGKSEGYWRRVQANPPEPPKINWDEYKKLVPIPGLVDKLKSAYEQFEVPYPTDTLTKSIDDQWQALQPEIKKYNEEREKEIVAATKHLDYIKSLPKFEEMTMEMVYDMYPGEALDPVNRPTFWPHNPEEQPNYRTPEQKGLTHLDAFNYKP